MANLQRTKAKLERLQQEISQTTKRTGIAIDNKVTIIQPKKFYVSFSFSNLLIENSSTISHNVFFYFQSDLKVPEIEWWDSLILQQTK